MVHDLVNTGIGMRNVLVTVAIIAWTVSAEAQFDQPPPEGSNLICIQADPPVVVLDSARLAARLVGFKAPRGLSVKQSQRLSQVARAFRAGHEQHALQIWGAAVTDAVQTVGARNLVRQDIEDLVLTVLRQVVADQADDLRLVIAQIEHVNAQKAELRDYLDKLRDQQADLQQRCPDNCDVVTQAAVDAEVARVGGELDDLNESSELLQLRLQQVMASRGQVIAMLSNLLKKMSDAAESVIQRIGGSPGPSPTPTNTQSQ